MTRLSIIIVSYNVKDYLEKTLQSVVNSLQKITNEIYVVDNASVDGSVDMVRENFPAVTLIENGENLGFACANNTALKQVSGEILVLLNPDTLVRDTTFSILLEEFQKYPEAGMIGCKVLNEDGSLQLSCRRSFPTPWVALSQILGLGKLFPESTTFARYNLTYLDPDTVQEVDAVSGSFMAIRREVLEKVGYLDERFFMYGEDLDWCWRIKQSGLKILYTPETSITHFKGKSTDLRQWKQVKQFYKAMILFSEKHLRSYSIFAPLWLIKIVVWKFAIAAFIWRRMFGKP